MAGMRSDKIIVITVVQTRNRFFRFLDDKTSVLHNEIRYTTKFSPMNWGYSSYRQTGIKRRSTLVPSFGSLSYLKKRQRKDVFVYPFVFES